MAAANGGADLADQLRNMTIREHTTLSASKSGTRKIAPLPKRAKKAIAAKVTIKNGVSTILPPLPKPTLFGQHLHTSNESIAATWAEQIFHGKLHKGHNLRGLYELSPQYAKPPSSLTNPSQWLFNADRQGLHKLSQAEEWEYQYVRFMQQEMKEKRPDEYFFLCFMNLAQELRELVYTAKFENLPTSIVLRQGCWRHLASYPARTSRSGLIPKLLPPLCYTNRQIFYESVPILLRNRKITIGSRRMAYHFNNFLNRVPNQIAYWAISRLNFESHTRWVSAVDIPNDNLDGHSHTFAASPLVARCSGLKYLTLHVYAMRLIDSPTTRAKDNIVKTNLNTKRHLAHGIQAVRMASSAKQARMALGPLHQEMSSQEPYFTRRPHEKLIRDWPLENLLACSQLRSVTLVCEGGDWFERIIGELKLTKTDGIFEYLVEWFEGELKMKKPHVKFDVQYTKDQNLPDCMGWEQGQEQE